MNSKLLLLLTLFMLGCGKTKQAEVKPWADDPYALLNFNLKYITALNRDTAAISRCTVEELKTGSDQGLICQEACETGELLIKFEQDNQSCMRQTNSKPSKQHRWCGGHR